MPYRYNHRALLSAMTAGLGLTAIASCGSPTSTLTSAPPSHSTQLSSTQESAQASSAFSSGVSLIYQDDPTLITPADIALVLAEYYLPGNSTEETLAEAAGNLLLPNAPLGDLSPLPVTPNVDWAEPAGILSLEDAAVIQAALRRDVGDRTFETLADDAGRLLDQVGIAVRAIPGVALPPTTSDLLIPSQPVNGQINTTDFEIRPGVFADVFELLPFNADQFIQIDLISTSGSSFDPFLEVVDRNTNAIVAQDNNGGEGRTSARIFFTANAGVPYQVRATSATPNQTGNYTLSANADPFPNHDILDVTTSLLDTTLTLDVTFANAIAAPSSGRTNAVFGMIRFDLDEDVNTPFFDDGILGVEAFIDLSSEDSFPNQVELVNEDTLESLGFVPIAFSENSFSISIPLANLLDDDGSFNYRIEIENLEQQTDVYPNQGVAIAPGTDTDPSGDTF